MTLTTIVIGYDTRTWTTFDVKDATPEEVEILAEQSEESVKLAQKLEADGRLAEINTQEEAGVDKFESHRDPQVVEAWTEE
jgi:hypothetical protein